MIICSDFNHDCPLFNLDLESHCPIFHSFFKESLEMHVSKDCSLMRIKLKDGTTFEPEDITNKIVLDLDVEKLPGYKDN